MPETHFESTPMIIHAKELLISLTLNNIYTE